jgi:DNA invertase Pin-like site-specific DNA recombinase
MMTSALPHAYIRRSVASRADPGDVSRDFQTEEVRRLAGDDAARLVIIDRDWGRSAATDKTGKRLAFLALLDSIEAGDVSALYAYSTDRLARSVEWSARLLNACRRAGVPIVTREGRIEPGNAAAALLFNVLAAVNENALSGMEAKARASIGARQARNVAAGRTPNAGMGRKAYGPEITALVLSAFDEAGSFLGAAKALNAAGVPTMLGLPDGWNVKTVSRIVRRERPEMPRTGRQGARARSTRLFSGLLRCGGTLADGSTCGGIMSSMPRPGQRTPAYYCRQAHNKTAAGHSRPYVISEARLRPAIMAESEHYAPTADEYNEADRTGEVAQLEGERARTLEQSRRGMIDMDEAERIVRGIKTRLDELAIPQAIPQAISWTAPVPELNAWLRAVWSAVQLGPDLLPVLFDWTRKDWRAD